MTDFQFSLKDLNDPEAIAAQINKYTPNNLKTTYSINPRANPKETSIFSIADVMLGIPALKDEKEQLALIKARISGGLGHLVGSIGDLPGIRNLIPQSIIDEYSELDPANIAAFSGGQIGEGGFKDAIEQPFEGRYTESAVEKISEAISIARGEIGYTESPFSSNRTKYHDELDIAYDSWCATFMMWVMTKVGATQNIKYMTPYTETIKSNYEKLGRTGRKPVVGALYFMNFSSDPARTVSHVGLVIRVEDDHIITVDGNTTDTSGGSQDNGGMVAEKRRKRSDVVTYAYPYYPEAVPAVSPAPVPSSPPSGETVPVILSKNNLATTLRSYGLTVEEVDGWQTYRASSGLFDPIGVMNHHTAGLNALDVIVNGNGSVPGPLSQFYLDKEGTVFLVSQGKCNHAGRGSATVLDEVAAGVAPSGTGAERGLPNDSSLGNQKFWGIEVENKGDGEDPYPDAQIRALVNLNAALCHMFGYSSNSCIHHKEWTNRKVDMSYTGNLRAAIGSRLLQLT